MVDTRGRQILDTDRQCPVQIDAQCMRKRGADRAAMGNGDDMTTARARSPFIHCRRHTRRHHAETLATRRKVVCRRHPVLVAQPSVIGAPDLIQFAAMPVAIMLFGQPVFDMARIMRPALGNNGIGGRFGSPETGCQKQRRLWQKTRQPLKRGHIAAIGRLVGRGVKQRFRRINDGCMPHEMPARDPGHCNPPMTVARRLPDFDIPGKLRCDICARELGETAKACYINAVIDRSRLPEALGQPGVRVHTLLLIRWMAIIGQSLTLAIVAIWLDFQFPRLATAATVLASVALNVSLTAFYRPGSRVVGAEAMLHLGFDLVQLGVLLYLTGGLFNPFCLLLIVPVTIAATLLCTRTTFILIMLSLGIIAVLFFWSLPLPWKGVIPTLPTAYRLGHAAALVFTLVFLALYALSVASEARRWQQALVATQAALERETKMSALGALAAAAAHELGGPLGTITLVARDLEDALAGDPDFGADVALLTAEAKRAGAILSGIAQRAEATEPFSNVSMAALLHEIAQPHSHADIEIMVETDHAGSITIARTPELVHGLANIIDNAVRHAKSRVMLLASATETQVALSISDDGDGFADDVLPKLGEPYLGPSISRRGGMGLGVFIATTLLERTGARLRFENGPHSGAYVTATWPRAQLEQATDNKDTSHAA